MGMALEKFGRVLYETLRPLGDFTETIHGVTDRSRDLRRFLSAPWDLVRQWRLLEPPESRLAMPAAVVMAWVSLFFL